MKSFKKQQKEDKKLLEDLLKEFTKEELAKMVVRERKRKNKYLSEITNDKKKKVLSNDNIIKMIQKNCNVINKPCNDPACEVSEVCKLNFNKEGC